MIESDLYADAVLERMADCFLPFREALVAARSEWLPQPPPPYLVMADYAEVLTANVWGGISVVELFAHIENYIQLGGPEADLVAVGFLEALLGRASAGRFDFTKVVKFLGPKSLEFCLAWDQFTGCTTVVDAQRRTFRK